MVITCSNCGGHTLLKERYGKCDWCGSPLEAEQMPIPPKRKRPVSSILLQNQELTKNIYNILDKRGVCSMSEIADSLNISNQKTAALLRAMIDDGIVERKEKFGTVLFSLENA